MLDLENLDIEKELQKKKQEMEMKRMIKDLNNKDKSGTVALDVASKLFSMDIENKQDYVNEIYRNLSKDGWTKMNEAIRDYNKFNKDDQLQSYTKYMSQYEDKADLLTNMAVDGTTINDVDEQGLTRMKNFDNVLKEVRNEDMQDVVNMMYGNVSGDKEKLGKLRNAIDKFNEKNGTDLSVVDKKTAQNKANEYVRQVRPDKEKLKILSPEQQAKYKQNLNKNLENRLFLDGMNMRHEDFQEMLNSLEGKLTNKEKEAMDNAVYKLNKHKEASKQKTFETPRVKNTIVSKFMYNYDNAEKSLKAFRDKLNEIKKDLVWPRSRHDHGIINTALRCLTNLAILTEKAVKFVAEKINKAFKEGYEFEDREKVSNQRNRFYDVIKDAYKEQCDGMVRRLDLKLQTKDEVKDKFIHDMAFIKSHLGEEQNEILDAYADAMKRALKNPDLSHETRQEVFDILKDYELGKFDQEIMDIITGEKKRETNDNREEKTDKNREQSSGSKKEKAKTEPGKQSSEQKHEPDKETHKRNAKEEMPSKQGAAAKKAERIIEMHNIGKSIAEGDYKNADEATVAFVNKISSFAYDNPGMSKYEVDAMTKIAVASVMAHDMADKDFARELKMNLNQYSTEKFDINSETSRIHVLLDAVEKVDYAMKIQGKDRDYNPLKEDLHESMKSSLSKAKTPNERQKFISDIANNLRSDSKQYLLAMEAKQFGVKAEGPDKLKNDYIINDKISRLSERYIISSKTGHNLDSKEIFIGLCDKMPEEKGGAQAVFDKMKDALKDNKDALKMLKQDALEYSAMNKEVGLPVIDVDKKEKSFEKDRTSEKPKTKDNGSVIIDVKNEKNDIEGDLDDFTSIDVKPEPDFDKAPIPDGIDFSDGNGMGEAPEMFDFGDER